MYNVIILFILGIYLLCFIQVIYDWHLYAVRTVRILRIVIRYTAIKTISKLMGLSCLCFNIRLAFISLLN